jgi:hypothetical protein
VVQRPEAKPVDTSSKTVALPGRQNPRRQAPSATRGLNGMRAISITNTEARITSAEGIPRTLRPGDSIEGDTVREIGDRRIILRRPDPKGGESTVIVTFDGQGRAVVRVISLHDSASPSVGIR